ncbi:hypothetical protein [Pseudoduganella rhizocola]|uniref:hypothetical protein n=1 Tax=Pseudoduganella rhizocola TaxID=3382643 RepID=UPI0038B6344A
MLRLWPEQITVGLFPGHCWLRRRAQVTPLDISGEANAGVLAAALDTLLGQAPVRGARVDIIASDTVARIVGLAWQEQLRTEAERHAYALAAFTHAGLPLDEDWACTTAFRHYGELGLGIACPAAWLAQLEFIARQHGCRLRTVLPVSAAAYWAPRRALGKGRAWIVTEEGGRAAALSFSSGRLAAYDAQPAGGDGRGLQRLLRRQALMAGTPELVVAWRVSGELDGAAISAAAPEAALKPLPLHYWDVHA